MKGRLGLLMAVAGASAVALSAAAQGSKTLSVADDHGYYCPDGRQIYVSRCYDESAQASCQYIAVHKPMTNGFQFEAINTRAELLSSLADCTLTPITMDNRGVVTVKKPAQMAQTKPAAKPPAAAAQTDSYDVVVPGPTRKVSLLKIAAGAASVHYVDELSVKPKDQKGRIEIWELRVFPKGVAAFPGAAAVWYRYLVTCKGMSLNLKTLIGVDRTGEILALADNGDDVKPAKTGSIEDVIAGMACNPAKFPSPRHKTIAAAIKDALTPAPPPTPVKAPIRLPETEVEKKIFQAIKDNHLQLAVSTIVKAPDGKSIPVVKLTDKQGMTALHWVTANSNAAGVRWLLDKHADVDSADEKGRTPLKIALDNKDTNSMRLLLNSGADAGFALPGHDDELKRFKKTDELIDFMIKNAAPAKN